MAPRVLALDLERTLVSDALRADPRPGLAEFLAFCCARFERVALFTTVEQPDARDALDRAAERAGVPAELVASIGYVPWTGEHKDLVFVAGAAPEEILFVEDDAGWVRPDQCDRWVPIAPWDAGPDNEWVRVREVLEQRLRARD